MGSIGVPFTMNHLPCLLLLATAALSAAAGATAQTFRPETVSGAVWGAVAGAVIGHNSGDLGHNAWRGAALGTVAGAVVGETVAARRERVSSPSSARVVTPRSPAPRIEHFSAGWSQRPCGHGYHSYPRRIARRGYPVYDPWGWHRAPPVWSPGYSVGVAVPLATAPADPRLTGALWGGAAGAVIGHNSGRRGWEGAALGSVAGRILGNQARPTAPASMPVPAAAPAATDAPAPAGLTVINHFHAPVTVTSGGANALFGR